MPITKEKLDELHRRMEKVCISEDDLMEKFILGSGKGGQKINKTSSCVYIKHLPTGTEVKCGRSRSREMNRFLARRELCEKIERKILGEKTTREREEAKIRRQKRRKSRRQKQKMIEEKRQTSEKKSLRKPPSLSSNDDV